MAVAALEGLEEAMVMTTDQQLRIRNVPIPGMHKCHDRQRQPHQARTTTRAILTHEEKSNGSPDHSSLNPSL
jgi:hypothetical protein